MIPSIIKRACIFLPLLAAPATADFNLAALSVGGNLNGKLTQQRSDFLLAERALKKQQVSKYKEILPSIIDYPLTPHLQYKELNRRLKTLPYDDVDQFLALHANSYLGDQLLKSWLFTLAKNKRWHEYQSYYQHHMNNASLECYYLRARLHNGEAEALTDITNLWNVGSSRPKACDPLFDQWIEAGLLTDDIAWDRHRKAIAKGNVALARYISKYIQSEQIAKDAKTYRAIHNQPRKIFNTAKHAAQTSENKEIILYGLKRAAKRDPNDTVEAWSKYDAQQLFADSDRLDMQEHLAIIMAKKGDMAQAEALLGGKAAADDALIEKLIRSSLRESDWPKTLEWIEKLPQAAQKTERWRYWRARSLSMLAPEEHKAEIEGIYAELALTRSFYGFLAADTLGRDYKLVDRPVTPPLDMISALSQVPGMLRAREFLALNRINSARREWRYTTQDFGNTEMKAAGVVAQQWGWHRKGIQAMASARYWDDLQVRFPLAFQPQIEAASTTTQVEPHLLFAIARQESAFTPDARSRVGATGLMQLMPGTAKDTARKIGIRYRKSDLLKPEINIKLGGSYLKQLMGRFEGNRILVAAAYNAGPYRVSKWLSKDTEQLPYDVWIEIIPFKETRRYVQNVLAYSVIYGYRMGDEMPFIRENEARQML